MTLNCKVCRKIMSDEIGIMEEYVQCPYCKSIQKNPLHASEMKFQSILKDEKSK